MTIVIDPETIPVPVGEPEPYDPDDYEFPDEQGYPKKDWNI